MDFANESYVRVYTRDTMTWKRLNWQARCVWSLLLRKLDRAGVLDLEGLQPDEAVALATELPPEVIDDGLPRLFERGVIQHHDGVLIAPRFIDAQECTKSDALRAKEYRERRRSQALSQPSHNVTHESRDVTPPSRGITERTDRHECVTLRYAVLPSAVPSSCAVRGSERAREDWQIGHDWFVEAFLSGDPTQAPNVGKWRDDYATLGRKPEAERATVARVASADPWVTANRGGSATPGHFVKHWGRYKAGGPKTVDRGPSSSEQAEAARQAAVGSKRDALRKSYAERIRAARDEGDDVTATVLAAERDNRLARLESA